MTDQHWPMCAAVCVCGKADKDGSDFETEKLLPVAVGCYHRQTYPANRRKLLLVTEQENAPKLLRQKRFRGVGVRILGVDGNPPLGTLRNVAIRFAVNQMPGAYLIQWDADDWHANERMAVQMQAALSMPGGASFLKRQIAYSFSRNVAFVRYLRLYGQGHPPEGSPTMVHGTFCGPANEIRYPADRKGEDTPFWADWASGPGAVEVDNDARLYVRFAHGNSTSGDTHIMQDHARAPEGTWDLAPHEAEYLRAVLKWYPGLKQSPQPVGQQQAD
jgi:hypothetical protein